MRKQKKDDQVLKRRNIELVVKVLNDKTNAAAVTPSVSMTLAEIIEVVHTSKDNDVLFPAVQSIRNVLSHERNPPIDIVIKASLVKDLVTYLGCGEHPSLQFEAAWALTNIASGTSSQTRHVVESGAVTPFVKLLSAIASNVSKRPHGLLSSANKVAQLRQLGCVRAGRVGAWKHCWRWR